jgi:hypothetical protein
MKIQRFQGGGDKLIAITAMRAFSKSLQKFDNPPMVRIHLRNIDAVFLLPHEWCHGREILCLCISANPDASMRCS